MGNYIYLNGGIPITFNSQDIPKLEENEWLTHIIRIAIAFEREGIDGVRVEWHKGEDNRYFTALLAKPGSLGKLLLDLFVEEAIKNKHLPTIESALVIAKRLQKEYQVRSC